MEEPRDIPTAAANGVGVLTAHVDEVRLACLQALERKVLWLSTWMIHNANHLRPSRDGLKVGGHQASCASLVTLMTGLYFDVLRPQDRVAVKPHASPVFHAIQYLLGRQGREKLERFRAFGGAQSYPSRTKDSDDVDFSTGSVGLGVAITLFASLVQDYLRLKQLVPGDGPSGRMIALAGDAELDEGNVFEALLEGWKHDVRNVWWIIDYNRQSLDSVVEDRLFQRIDSTFQSMGWDVVTLKYGRRLQAVFERPGGEALRDWIDNCPNSLYSALVYRGGAGWRARLKRDLGTTRGIPALLDEHDDAGLHALMTNLGGHDMESVLEAFHGVTTDAPTCFIAYTIKGFGLPFAGHKDNHSGLMSPEQMEVFRQSQRIEPGQEYDPFAGLDIGRGRAPAVPRSRALRRPIRAAARAASRRRARGPGRPPGIEDVDPGGVRPDPERPGAGPRGLRRPDRDDLARRDGLDQSRRVGQPPRPLRPPSPRRPVPRGGRELGPEVGDVAGRPAHRAGHRREQPVPAPGRAGAGRAALRCPAVADRHALRPVHLPRTGRARTTPATRARGSSWWPRPRA